MKKEPKEHLPNENSIVRSTKIIVIEDDEGLNLLIRKKLQREGFQVDWAENGTDALGKISGDPMEVLLVDYNLPDMTGMELIERLITHFEKLPHFITMTGFGDEKIAVELMKLGAVDYIVKEAGFIDVLPEKLKHICLVIDQTKKLEEAEDQLRKQSQLLTETGQMAKVGGWRLNLRTMQTYFTDETFRIYGITGKTAPPVDEGLKYYAPEAQLILKNALKEAIENHQSYDIEVPFISAKGEELWVRTIGKAILEHGKAVELIGTIQDITKQKETENKLKISIAKHKRTEEIAHIGSWEWDMATETVSWSDELFRIFKLNPENGAASYTDHPKIYTPESMRRLDTAARHTLDTGKPFEIDLEIIRTDGTTRFCTTRGFAKKDEKGKVIGLFGSFQDITKQKKAEEELKALNQQLSSNEQQLRASNQQLKANEKQLLDLNAQLSLAQSIAKLGYWTYDIETQLPKWTDECFRMYNVAKEQGEPYFQEQKKYIHPDDWDLYESAVQKLISEDVPYDIQIRLVHDNGDILWMRTKGFPGKNVEGKVTELYGIVQDITEFKNSEKQLIEQKLLFETMFNTIEDAIVITDTKRKIMHANKGVQTTFGYSPEEIIGKETKILYDDDEEFIATGDTVFADTPGNSDNLYVTYYRDKEDEVFPGETFGTKLFDENGEWIGNLGVMRNISERMKHIEEIERAKHKAEENERDLFKVNEKLSVHNERLGALTRILNNDFSSQKEMLDYTLLQAIKLTDSKIGYIYFYNEEKKEFTLNTWSGEVMKECTVTDPETIYRLDATGCWGEAVRQRKPFLINDYSVPNALKKGTPEGHVQLKKFLTLPVLADDEIKAVIGVANKDNDYNNDDIKQLSLLMNAVWKIVERNQHQIEIISAKEKAEKNELELREAQKLSNVGSWQYDIKSETPMWSEETFRIWGLNKEAQIQNHQGHRKYIHPEDWDKFDTAVTDAINKGTAYNLELRIIRSSGEERSVITIGEPMFDRQGKITSLRGTVQDITERKKIENEWIAAKEKAEESDRLKSAFLANMSHEIRTPMNGILGFTGLLREANLSGEEQQKYIEIIQESGDRMLNTVNDIIDISKIESGEVDIATSEVNINKKLKYLHSFFEPEAAKKGIQFTFKNGTIKEDLSIKTDPEKFNSILTNLIKNALKFTTQGSIELGYHHTTDTKSEKVEFYVKDTGVGIPIARQQAIFDRFVQADIGNARAFEGSGLGLSIAKAYVEMLGGTIGLKSEVGVGSTFKFTLPSIPESGAIIEPQKNNSLNHSEQRLGKIKILVAEDDEINYKYLSIVLRKYASEILHVNNGLDAISTCKANPDLDLILMDIRMLGMNGDEATRRIREFNTQVVIIAQTAYALEGDREKTLAAGCNDYLSKPINKLELDTLINKHFVK